jgi:hypothetical protein
MISGELYWLPDLIRRILASEYSPRIADVGAVYSVIADSYRY